MLPLVAWLTVTYQKVSQSFTVVPLRHMLLKTSAPIQIYCICMKTAKGISHRHNTYWSFLSNIGQQIYFVTSSGFAVLRVFRPV
jgi:hypothetical protein